MLSSAPAISSTLQEDEMRYEPRSNAVPALTVVDAEQPATESMLRRTSIWMMLAASAGRLGFWSYELPSGRRWMSSEVLRILGVPRRSDHEESFLEAIHPEDRERVLVARELTMTTGSPFDEEFRIRRSDDEIRWVRATGRVLHDRDCDEFIGVIADVTASHHVKPQGMARRRHTAPVNRSGLAADLSGAVLHELKQPLTSILLNAQAAAGLLDADSGPANMSELRTILDEIIWADRRASVVMARVRSLLRNEPLSMERLLASDLVDDVLELTRGEIVLHQVTMERELDASVRPMLGDRVQLEQVLVNLIVNACEAMEGRPPAERRLTITVTPDAGGCSRISIADTGPGITLEPQSCVFEPFVTSKTNGLGLGLAICRKVIMAHGGRIWVENNEVGGATFHLRLPATAERGVFAPIETELQSNVSRRFALRDQAIAARTESRKLCDEQRALWARIQQDRDERADRRRGKEALTVGG
jgi:signal transduction histidine kinase